MKTPHGSGVPVSDGVHSFEMMATVSAAVNIPITCRIAVKVPT